MKTVGEFYKPDIAALPVGDIYTMGIEEAAIAAKWLGTKKVIPIHYNSFDVLKADTKALRRFCLLILSLWP
jgi:L-ascorbate metabolism protein UlaG (beta-lactamase superfamily)